MKKLCLLSLSAFIALPSFAQGENNQNDENPLWIDQQHQNIRTTLHNWSNNINAWLGEADPNKPASASLRLMWDTRWNKFDGLTYKPRIRGKIKLPVLKQKLNVVFGDDDLEDKVTRTKIGQNYEQLEKDRHYDSKQARNDNASIALRWSNSIKNLGIEADLDGGIRSGTDIYTRLRLSKQWIISENFNTKLEQIYRLGTKSKHYLRTNLENKYQETDQITLVNHSFLQYTHNSEEKTEWGNSIYREHNIPEMKRLSYGLFMGGSLNANKYKFNHWGPFINYRQPIFRNWVFIQPEVNFYNDKDNDRNHYLGAFLRLELLF